MTIYTMYSTFEDLVDKASSSSYPEIPDEQKDRFFNIACERFIKQRYGSTNIKNRGFEETQKRADDLSNLIRTEKLNILSNGIYSTSDYPSVIYPIPDDYWFSITERVKLRTKCNTIEVGVIQGRHNEISYRLNDPFNRPDENTAFRVIHSNQTTDNSNNVIEMFYNKNVIPLEYSLTYLAQYKKLFGINQANFQFISSVPNLNPAPNFHVFGPGVQTIGGYTIPSWFDIEFWFNPQCHQEIIDLAVEACLEVIEHPRFQTFSTQLNKQE